MIGLLSCFNLSYSQHYDAEVVEYRSVVEVNNGRLKQDLYHEIRINNRAGEKYTKIAIAHSKLYKVSGLIAYVKDSGGKIVKTLKKNDIIEKSAISD